MKLSVAGRRCAKLFQTQVLVHHKTTKLGIVEVKIWNIAFNNKFDKHESLWSLQKKENSEIIEIFWKFKSEINISTIINSFTVEHGDNIWNNIHSSFL